MKKERRLRRHEKKDSMIKSGGSAMQRGGMAAGLEEAESLCRLTRRLPSVGRAER